MSRMPTGHDVEDAGADSEPQSMSLMSGVAGGASAGGLSDAELLGVDAGGGGRRVSQSTLVLVAVAVVAAGSLYLMRLTQGDLAAGGAATEASIKIEEALAKLTQPKTLAPDDPLRKQSLRALFQDTDSIIAMFATDLSAHQVPLEQLKKNPFQIAAAPAEAGVLAADTTDRDRAKRLAELREKLETLSLNSIMISGNGPTSRKVAIINGEFYQPGQTVGGFTITSMDPLAIQLEAAGHSFQLTLNDKNKER